MSWTNLLAARTVQTHATGRNEITNLRKVVNRDLSDAAIDALSADRRFATAYNAVDGGYFQARHLRFGGDG